MLYISSRGIYDESNLFQLKEIFVSDGQKTFILSKDSGYVPYEYGFDLNTLLSTYGFYPISEFGRIRQFDDSDPKTLSYHLRDKIKSVDFSQEGAQRTMFEILENFGEPYDG